jgi:hypothetical protein
MTRLLAAGLLLAAGSCAPLREETRVERGAPLRMFERQGKAQPGGVMADVALQWPQAILSFSRYELCRIEQVEEVPEQRITERTFPGLGPSIGMGVTGTLIGLGLLVALPQVSASPNTQLIDANGRYGASERQVATAWSIGLLAVGLPALGFGAYALTQVGERTESKTIEQVALARDERCGVRPVDGPVALSTTHGEAAPRETQGGKISLDASALKEGIITGAAMGGEEVAFDPEAWDRLVDYQSCVRAMPVPAPEAVAAMEVGALEDRLELARSCVRVPGSGGEAFVEVLVKELQARGAEPQPEFGPRIDSWDAALQAYPPAAQLQAGSPELEKLGVAGHYKGQPVLVEGVLANWIEGNIVVLRVGDRNLWLYLDAERPWSEGLKLGDSLEVLAVVVGRQEIGQREAPLLRVIWLRPLETKG